MSTLIFDFGCNSGRNLEYYLLKADLVVAVEANPELIKEIKRNYAKEIEQKRLIIQECLLSTRNLIFEKGRIQSFYVNQNNLISSILLPANTNLSEWKELRLNAYTVKEVIDLHKSKHDRLLYCKFDLEGFDYFAVEEMLKDKIYPQYLSLEMNDAACFNLLIDSGVYHSFKLSPGQVIGRTLRKSQIVTKDSMKMDFTFEIHSAGPIYDDLKSTSFGVKSGQAIKHYRHYLQNWVDLHASLVHNQSRTSLWLERKYVFELGCFEFVSRIRTLSIAILPSQIVSFVRKSLEFFRIFRSKL